MKAKAGVLIVVALAIWGMKRHYSDARAEQLSWVLTPTATLVSAATGVTFTQEPGEGYLSRERRFVIEKSCAGVNFMIAAFGMSALVLWHRVRSWPSAIGVLVLSAAASYLTAIAVNATRIATALWLSVPAEAHRIEGITVYFGGLVLLYEVEQRWDRFAISRHR